VSERQAEPVRRRATSRALFDALCGSPKVARESSCASALPRCDTSRQLKCLKAVCSRWRATSAPVASGRAIGKRRSTATSLKHRFILTPMRRRRRRVKPHSTRRSDLAVRKLPAKRLTGPPRSRANRRRRCGAESSPPSPRPLSLPSPTRSTGAVETQGCCARFCRRDRFTNWRSGGANDKSLSSTARRQRSAKAPTPMARSGCSAVLDRVQVTTSTPRQGVRPILGVC
jgi:hypothetical protein